MPFWHTPAADAGTEVPAAEQQRQDADRVQLARGGIPTTARRRLTALKQTVAAGGSFTSTLSPSAAALLHHGGYRPLGMVGGSTIYAVGIEEDVRTSDGELFAISRAYKQATTLAVDRLHKEARELRAHGVVGVRFSCTRYDWAERCVEIQLLGTAVVTTEARTKRPWLSDLSGQDWWALHHAGYAVAGIVYGHSAWLVRTTGADAQIARNRQNQEVTHLSEAYTQSRTVAHDHLQAMAQKLEAAGVVGMHLAQQMEAWEHVGEGGGSDKPHVLLTSLLGTAIHAMPGDKTEEARTQPVVWLR